MIGTIIAHYCITAKLGEGGMGVVYRASDTKLHRDVALKLLPEELTADPSRRSRFQREAQLLAALNHPNIAAVYGIEDNAIVMELVEGPTLADRIATGPIPPDEALPIARQIADALEAAHDKGIIHRDLKPANIKLTPDVQVKVLDFGLAKALDETPARDSNPANSPTLVAGRSLPGLILGTASYMSPEQARGGHVDKRTDIWAFGVVLYEMLTAKRLFEGETISDTLAQVLTKEPDLTAVPAGIRPVLERCLQRDRKQRLRDIGDLWLTVQQQGPPPAESGRWRGRPFWIAAASMAVAAASLAALAYTIASQRQSVLPAQHPHRFELKTPSAGLFPRPAVSPDGLRIVIAGYGRLLLRHVNSLANEELPGTENAQDPFWSPDGNEIGFFSFGKLRKFDLARQTVASLADAPVPGGAIWTHYPGDSGTILFANGGDLYRMPGEGGVATLALKRATYPVLLHEGQRFLYFCGKDEQAEFCLTTLDGGTSIGAGKPLLRTPYQPLHYWNQKENSGYLIYRYPTGQWVAQRIDERSGSLEGSRLPVAEAPSTGMRYVRASTAGSTFVYTTSTDSIPQLELRDRAGNLLESIGEPGDHQWVAFSPDDRLAAVATGVGDRQDIFFYDPTNWKPVRFTFHNDSDGSPIFTPDGAKVIYATRASNGYTLVRRPVTGGAAERLIDDSQPLIAHSVSPQGDRILYGGLAGVDRRLYVRVWEERTKQSVPFSGTMPGAICPTRECAQWVATASNSNGQYGVFVNRYPEDTQRFQVSTGSGVYPAWRADGKELFYLAGDGYMMAVPVKAGSTFEAGTPVRLFPLLSRVNYSNRPYAVSSDGKRFLVIRTSEPPLRVVVVTNWGPGTALPDKEPGK